MVRFLLDMFCPLEWWLVKFHALYSFQSSMILYYSFCLQISNSNCRYLFRVSKLLGIHWFKPQFCQLIVKGFHKGCVGMLVFCCRSLNIKIVFFKELCHFIFKLRRIITLKYLGIFKHATLFIDCFQHKCNFLDFLVLKSLVTLYLDATSMPVKIY